MSITRASNGNGVAVQTTVEIIRAPGNMILDVVSTQNWVGVNPNGTFTGERFHFASWTPSGEAGITPGSLTEGKAHVSNTGEITIDSFDPGFTDNGNSIGDVIMIKPTTGWANDLYTALRQSMDDEGKVINVFDAQNNTIAFQVGGTQPPAQTGKVVVWFEEL